MSGAINDPAAQPSTLEGRRSVDGGRPPVDAGTILPLFGTDPPTLAPDALVADPVRVLLCDDDPVMSSALSELIETAPGFELVGVAVDAASAAALAMSTNPDAVLLDVRMPGGGWTAARRIREVVPTARLVALSAHCDPKVVGRMLQAGVMEYLVKGVNSDLDILDAIRRKGYGHFGLNLSETEELVVQLIHLLAAEQPPGGEPRDTDERP